MEIRKYAASPGILLFTFGLAAAAPALTASLSFSSDPQPLPEGANSSRASPLAIESWAAGSASLVPLMAADTQATPQDPNVDAPAATQAVGKPIDDVSFVRRATESGRKEIASARDAAPQLKRPELKRMAEMLVQDHTAANTKLSKIAETKGWPLPAPQATAAAPPPDTGTASGSFDDKWTAEMIAGHERSVALYRAQAQGGEDKDLRQYARDTLPTIEHHLAELKKLQK
jgi:putative membrane protein